MLTTLRAGYRGDGHHRSIGDAPVHVPQISNVLARAADQLHHRYAFLT